VAGGAKYQLGVDVGTTYTAAAVHRDRKVEVVSLGDRAMTIPSVVHVASDGSVLVGEAADRRAVPEPERVAREFKRRMGDATPMLLGGAPYSAEALTAKLLRWVVDKVSEVEGGPPEAIAVTHPANWGPFKLDRLDQAIRLADLDGVTTLTEPEAAAIHYASNERVEPGAVVAVYDLGGGTFDAAVLRKSSEGWEILGSPEGIEQLGGIDIDETVFEHVRQAVPDAFTDLELGDGATAAAVARLRRDCVDAKEALSADTDVSIPVLLPRINTEVRLTRAELESFIGPRLQDTVGALNRALRSAGVQPDEVAAVLLVGGSSRIPYITQLVSAALHRPVAVDAHPKHAVALGAARAAAATVGTDRAGSVPPPAPAAVVDPLQAVPSVSAVDPPPASVVDPPQAVPSVSAVDPPPAPAPARSGRAADAQLTPPSPPAADPRPAPLSPSATDAPPGDRAEPPPPDTPPRHLVSDGRRRRALALVGAGLVVLAVAAVVGVRALGGGDGSDGDDGETGSSSTSASTTTTALPAALALGQRVAAGAFPDGIALDQDGRLWVAATAGDQVARIDPMTGEADTVPAPPNSDPLAVAVTDDGAVWVTLRNDAQVIRLDPGTMEVTDTVAVAEQPSALGVQGGLLWVLGADAGTVQIVDPSSREVVETIETPAPGGIAFTDTAAWVTNGDQDTITEIDLATRDLGRTIQVGDGPDSVVADADGLLWVTNRRGGTVSRIDPVADEATEISVGTNPADVVIDGDRIWLTDNAEGELVLIDRARAEVANEIAVGSAPLDLVVVGDSVWVSVTAENSVVEVVAT
jgi:streptogramin lyase/actin-like ATPase involved in cell morphogenesis